MNERNIVGREKRSKSDAGAVSFILTRDASPDMVIPVLVERVPLAPAGDNGIYLPTLCPQMKVSIGRDDYRSGDTIVTCTIHHHLYQSFQLEFNVVVNNINAILRNFQRSGT